MAVANGKGGVFKTSLVTTLAGLAGMAGYRVLVVDLDPQGNVGDDFGYLRDGRGDGGAGLVRSLMLDDQPLAVTLTEVRQNVDVITGGEQLNDLASLMVARGLRGNLMNGLLAAKLAKYLANKGDQLNRTAYDLVLLDCPPGEPTIQLLALTAARWLVIPTKADDASLRGMAKIAARVVEARTENPDLELLGVVLCDILPSATRLRKMAGEKIEEMLGGVAPLFKHVIRNSTSAYTARGSGMLAHEYAESIGAEPFYKALQEGRSPSSAGTAPALAADYALLAQEILTRIAAMEEATDDATKVGASV